MVGPISSLQLWYPCQYVLHIELIRPAQNGGFSDVFEDLGAIFNSAINDEKVRVVILSGVCDTTLQVGVEATALARDAGGVQKCVFALEACIKPVICITQGVCSASGTALACACDVRISTSNTIFTLKGAEASGVNAVAMLAKEVCSFSWLRDVSLTRRGFQANEAYRMGFASRICGSKTEAFNEALRLALMIADRSIYAVQTAKMACVRELQPNGKAPMSYLALAHSD
uniref:ScyR2 n=1 Tax=Scytalidium album TaxID=1525810 RepID=A0A8A5D4W0_9PEZI|nr:ScyR2 [Scytalidium album]